MSGVFPVNPFKVTLGCVVGGVLMGLCSLGIIVGLNYKPAIEHNHAHVVVEDDAQSDETAHYYGHHSHVPRSDKWPTARKHYIAEHPDCEYCGHKGPEGNEVHHKQPFHKNPELELDPKNFRTLCRPCHKEQGHLGNWHSWNPDLDKDILRHRKEVENRPQ